MHSCCGSMSMHNSTPSNPAQAGDAFHMAEMREKGTQEGPMPA